MGGDLRTGPAFVAFDFGSIELVALHDGGASYPPEFVFGEASGTPSVRARYGLDAADSGLWLPYAAFAIVEHGVTTLVDTGGSPELFPQAGRLEQSMTLAGIAPQDVDHIVLTHAHPDHIGGLVDAAGAPRFPNADVLIDPRELSYWTDRGRPRGDSDADQVHDLIANVLGQVETQIVVTTGSTEPSPSVSLHPTQGHSPGHLLVRVEVDPPLWIVGDLLLLDLFIEEPQLRPGDIPGEQPQRLRAEIRAFCRTAASENALVVASHLPPFPSLGSISSQDGHCRWHPFALPPPP